MRDVFAERKAGSSRRILFVKTDVLAAMEATPEWAAKLQKVETFDEIQQVFTDFCKATGRTVITMEEPKLEVAA